MRSLVVDDEFTSRMLLMCFLEGYGSCDVAANGAEAVESFKQAAAGGSAYDLICLDIIMPEKGGHEALREIRKLEREAQPPSTRAAKIFMTTALSDMRNVRDSFGELCDEYLMKPIDRQGLDEALRKHGLVR